MKKFIVGLVGLLIILTGGLQFFAITVAEVERWNSTVTVRQLTLDPWRMFRHDAAHTGYSTSGLPAGYGILWNFTADAGLSTSPAIVDGKLYIGSDGTELYCLNSTTGTKYWNTTIPGGIVSAPAVSGGRVFVHIAKGAYPNPVSGNLAAYSISTGGYLWDIEVDAPSAPPLLTPSAPTVSGGRVFIGGYDRVVSIGEDGTGISTYPTPDPVIGSPAVDGGRVFVGAGDCFYALNQTTLALNWKFNTTLSGVPNTGGQITSSASVSGGMVFFGCNDGLLYALDVDGYPDGDDGVPDSTANRNSGSDLVWYYRVAAAVTSSPAVAGGCVFFGADDGYIYAVNASSGTLVWRTKTDGAVQSSPAVAGERLFISSTDGGLYILNSTDGRVVAVYLSSLPSICSPAIADSMVYMGFADGTLCAFGLASQPLLSVVVQSTPSGILERNTTSQLKVSVRYQGNPIQGAGVMLVANNDGTFAQASGTTNANGEFLTTFQAPDRVTNCTIMAQVEKTGYAISFNHTRLRIGYYKLNAELMLSNNIVISGQQAQVMVKAFNETALPEPLVFVELTTTAGSCNPSAGNTNGNGEFTALFTAPVVTSTTMVTVWANLSKQYYLNCSKNFTVAVIPSTVLTVSFSASTGIVHSDSPAALTVRVTDHNVPIANANVQCSVTSGGGTVNPPNGLTDFNGYFNTTFWSPLTDVQTICIIRANISRSGYLPVSENVTIVVVVGTVQTVILSISPATVISGNRTSVRVQVMDGNLAVRNASVNLYSMLGGTFSPVSGLTDSSGVFRSIFTVPVVTVPTICRVFAETWKRGYSTVSACFDVTITPGSKLNITILAEPPAIRPNGRSRLTITVEGIGQLIAGAGVSLWTNSSGRFVHSSGITDANGTFVTEFIAPSVPSYCRIVANATKQGYLNGSKDELIIVTNAPILSAQLSLSSSTVRSGGSVLVVINVTDGTNPVANAFVELSSSSGGTFVPLNGTTATNGTFQSTFFAPVVSVPTSCKLFVNASKPGYCYTVASANLTVIPLVPQMVVEVVAKPMIVRSGGIANLTVHVYYGATNIQNASLTLASTNGGIINPPSGMTDITGNFSALFFAPIVFNHTMCTITVTAMKSGYALSTGVCYIIVTAGTHLQVTLSAQPAVVGPEEECRIVVHVTDGVAGVPAAIVNLSTNSTGIFQNSTGLTNAAGYFNTTFIAPAVSALTYCQLMVVASKQGYLNATNSTLVVVTATKSLTAFVIAEPSIVQSGRKTKVTVTVMEHGSPVENVRVRLASERGGSFEHAEGKSDRLGEFSTNFTAPVVSSRTICRLTANVSKKGYYSAENYTEVTVEVGAVLQGLITAQPTVVRSGKSSNITVHVNNGSAPVAGAEVRLSATRGSFAIENGTTDAAGNFSTLFFAPVVDIETVCKVIANISKSGYAPITISTRLTVISRFWLEVTLSASPIPVPSMGQALLVVKVTDGVNPISNATVNFSATNEGFVAPPTGLTDETGVFMSTFSAPSVSSPTVCIVYVEAWKQGYYPAQASLNISVLPPGTALIVQIAANPAVIGSNSNSTITVAITNGTKLFSGATLSFKSSCGGTFSNSSDLGNGLYTVCFNAPQVAAETKCLIGVTVTYSGYIPTENQTELTIVPARPSLYLALKVCPFVVNRDGKALVSVNARNSALTGAAVADVRLFFSVSRGELIPAGGHTDSNGYMEVSYQPRSSAVWPSVAIITLTGTKSGWVAGQSQYLVLILPHANHAPAVSILSPLNGTTLSGLVELRGTANDEDSEYQLIAVELMIDITPWFKATGTTAWRYLWNTTLVRDGIHWLYVRAYDGTVYSQTEQRMVIVRNAPLNNPPIVTIDQSFYDRTLSGIVRLFGTARDPDTGQNLTVRIRIDAGIEVQVALNLSSHSWYYDWDTRTVQDGQHTVYVTAFDGLNSTTVSCTVTVSNYPPRHEVLSPELIAAVAAVLSGVAVALLGWMLVLRRRKRRVKD